MTKSRKFLSASTSIVQMPHNKSIMRILLSISIILSSNLVFNVACDKSNGE